MVANILNLLLSTIDFDFIIALFDYIIITSIYNYSNCQCIMLWTLSVTRSNMWLSTIT